MREISIKITINDKIYEKNDVGDWIELTGNFFDKVFDYYCDLFEKKMSLGE